MNIRTINILYFSPTGTTRKTLENIVKGMDSAIPVNRHDLSKPEIREQKFHFAADELLIIGMPVYAGRIPALFGTMDFIIGEGSPVVCVAVYGNRHYDDALLELSDLCKARGMRPVAGAAFIAQHSLNPHMGEGRPDGGDIRAEKDFGAKILKKLLDASNVEILTPPTMPGNYPYKPLKKMPLAPDLYRRKCNRCGRCAKDCPVEAIDPQTLRLTKPEVCLFCFRCVKYCPEHARGLRGIKKWIFNRKMKKLGQMCQESKKPEIFL